MHIKEEVIEKFIIAPESIDEKERIDIQNHLIECSKCSDVFYTLQNIYIEYEKLSQKTLDEEDVRLTEKILEQSRYSSLKLLPPGENKATIKYYSSILSQKAKSSIKNIYYYFRYYPVRSLSLSFIFLVLTIFSFNYLKTSIFKDRNPFYLTKENAFIKVYNKDGKFLWQIFAKDLPDKHLDSLVIFSYPNSKYVYLEDIDNDNKKELLITGSVIKNPTLFSSDTLYCYNYNGTLRWKTYAESQEFNYAPHWRRTKWVIQYFEKIKTKNGLKLFLLANDEMYAGTVMSLIDPKDGKILSSTYLAGHTKAVLLKDIDKDGFQEIIIGGFSTYKKSRIAILKTDFFMGVLPDYYSENYNLIKSNALYFILLPYTELCEKSIVISERFVTDLLDNQTYGGFSAIAIETIIDNSLHGLVFAFDSLLTCKYVSPTGRYTQNYDKYFKNRIVSSPLDSTTREKLKNEILYWDGDNFVKYPTKNKYWNQPFRLPNGEIALNPKKD